MADNNNNLGEHWIYCKRTRIAIVLFSIVSFISLCLNTPQMRNKYPVLGELTISFDIIVGIVFSSEMCLKMRIQGIFKGYNAYFKHKVSWLHFMDTLALWISITMQITELSGGEVDEVGIMAVTVVARSIRAFVIIRAFQYFLSSVGAQMTAIVIRASQHIAGVTLFLVFFILLYGIVGVQMFGDFKHHCVTNDTNPENVTLRNLAIPDTTCSLDDSSMCPPGMVCKHVHLHRPETTYGSFGNIAYSLKTVYSAASQEGWVFLMYKSIDSHVDWLGYFYFMSLILFLAWLVRNVFIAVIINAFAEIRAQLHNLWGNTGATHNFTGPQLELSTEGDTWKLAVAEDASARQGILQAWKSSLKSRCFHIVMQGTIILNVAILAFQPRNYDTFGEREWDFFRVSELVFTIVFDLEAVMKICCMGIKGYFWTYQYEAFLASVTTVNAFIDYDPLRSAPVLRIIRLVKLSPTLECFVSKILGPTKKIGALVVFTFSIILLMSCFSLQLFCHGKSEHFKDFLVAFMSMFQIVMQEGWVDVMHDVIDAVGQRWHPFVIVYFIAYHFFASTVLISLFVAVILDNLELEENVKRFKQQKINEQNVDTKQKLPWRLRVFARFPNQPQRVNLSCRMPTEFQIPGIRESYMRQFLESKYGGCSDSAASTRAQIRAQFSPSCQLVESPAIGSFVRSGINLQFAGAAMSPKQFFEAGLLNPEGSLKNTASQKRHVKTDEMQERVIKMPHLEQPQTYSKILNKCIEYRKSNNMANGRGSPHFFHFRHRSMLTNRPSVRSVRVPFAEGSRQTDIDNIYMLEKQSSLNVDFQVLRIKRQEALLKRERQERELRENHPLYDTPLFTVSRESKLRRICQSIAYSRYKPDMKKYHSNVIQSFMSLLGSVTYLDWVAILVTIASCSFIMMETPTCRVSNSKLLLYAEYGFVICTSMELLLKLMAGGLFFTPKPVLKDIGGVLDCFIYLVSVIFLLTRSESVPAQGGGQFLMVLRALRPLRIFRLVPQIRNVVIELFRGFKNILMVAILLIALMFVFANIGVGMFGGKLAACNDRSIKKREDCTGIFFQHVWISNSIKSRGNDIDEPPGFMVPRVWTNPRNFNFDNIGSAMLTLFEVLSLKGWIEVRDILMEQFGMMSFLYIHVFVFLGSTVGLTLFIGVVVANYNENKGTALLTVDQRRWENLKCRSKIAQLLHRPPRPDGDGIRAKAYDLSQHEYFKCAMVFCIVVEAWLLFVKWGPDNEKVKISIYFSVALNVVFTIEVTIKWAGMTFWGMVASHRNKADLIITALSIVWSISFAYCTEKDMPYKWGVALIILRFITVSGKRAVLKMLMTTVGVSVYKSFFIIGAMFLLMLCYAFAGVVLFGTVKYGESIDRHANFETAPMAITVLFRIVTGEDWNKIMHDCTIQPPRCTTADNYWDSDCGNVSAALIYFCSFYVIISYIMLNVLVAIIMENFSLFYTMDEEIQLSYNDLNTFQRVWNVIDTKRKGTIPLGKVRKLLEKLKVDPVKDRLLLKHMCYEMELVSKKNGSNSGKASDGNGVSFQNENHLESTVSFHDVLMMLAYRSVDIRKSLQLDELLVRERFEAEIVEAVATTIIQNFILRCNARIKRIKPREANISKQEQMIIPCDMIVSEDVSGREEREDATEEQCEFSFPRKGKLRKMGMWRPPPAYHNGSMVSNIRQRRTISESDNENDAVSTALSGWWSENINV